MAVRIEWDQTTGLGDLATDSHGMTALDGGLETAVILSLYSDRRAADGDDLQIGASRRGWWGDSLADDGDQWGSRLWLLDRSKSTEETLELAKLYAEEALAWMLEDGIARRLQITVERVAELNGAPVPAHSQMLDLRVSIEKADGARWDSAWKVTIDGIQ